MNRVKIILFLLLIVPFSPAVAQYSISKVKPSSVDPKAEEVIRGTNINNDYFSKARWDAEQRKIRKERNMVEFNSSLQISQSKFENWAAGGDNTFSGRSTLYFRHQYKREKLTIDYKFDGKFGINFIESKLFKNEDEFKFNFQVSWKIKNNWSYATTGTIRSQFTNGYKSRKDNTLISAFMAPGFIDLSVGFNYHKDKSPFSMTISPIAGSLVVVLDKELSKKGINGVEKGKKSKGQLGPSFRADFDKTFYKDIFRYRSSIYSFTNIKTAPTVRWDNVFEIRATKFLVTTVNALAYYDKLANTPKPQKLQLNYTFTIGLSYRFKNK